MSFFKKGYISRMNLKLAVITLLSYFLLSISITSIILYFTVWGIGVKLLNNFLIVLLFILGIYQIIFGKLRVKKYRGRKWGIIFLIMCSINLCLLTPFIQLDIKINENYQGNKEEIRKVKSALLSDKELLNKELEKNEIIKLDNKISELNNVTRDNITFYYEDGDSNAIECINQIESVIKEQEDKIIELLGIEEVNSVNIVVLKDLKSAEENFEKSLAFYSYDSNSIYVLNSSKISDVENLKKKGKLENYYSLDYNNCILKQYINYKLRNYIENNNIDYKKIPSWFIDGVEQYLSDECSGLVTPSKVVTDEVINLREYEDYDGNDIGLYYKKVAVFIKYIVNTDGTTSLKSIIDNIKEGYDFYDSLEKVTNKSYEEIDKEIS